MQVSEECGCCPNKAKYDVDGDRVCGRHLAHVIKKHLATSYAVKVARID